MLQPIKNQDKTRTASDASEKRQSLDLDALLGEFKAVAQLKVGLMHDHNYFITCGIKCHDRRVSQYLKKKHHRAQLLVLSANFYQNDSTSLQLAVGDTEKEWLESAGLSALTEKFAHGEVVTNEDIKSQTVGLTPLQVHAVRERVATLNG